MHILIIEDDPSIQMLLKLSLEVEGFRTAVAGSASQGMEALQLCGADLILLDFMLPDRSGLEVLMTLNREYPSIPVIVLTAKNEMNDKILGFQLGADDYLTKPFETRELIMRIRAVMRRIKPAEPSGETIRIGAMEVDKRARSLKLAGVPVKTTSKEFDFLWLLCSHPKKVFTREELLEQVWGFDYSGQTRSVDMLVGRLRDKMRPYDHMVATVHGSGYKLEG